jgi:glucan phosphoethanolaminetransferase (alkaline phosphatase superfamily)
MDNWLFRAKHWQVFLLFTLGYFASAYSTHDFLTFGLINVVLLVLYVGWYAVLGNSLHPYLPRGRYYNLSWFFFDAFLIIATYGVAITFFNGQMQMTGLAALLGFYLFFAIARLFWFPAAVLVSIETRNEPVFRQYASTMLLMFFWPLGVWFIQPRLNRIYNSIQADTLDYPRS